MSLEVIILVEFFREFFSRKKIQVLNLEHFIYTF